MSEEELITQAKETGKMYVVLRPSLTHLNHLKTEQSNQMFH